MQLRLVIVRARFDSTGVQSNGGIETSLVGGNDVVRSRAICGSCQRVDMDAQGRQASLIVHVTEMMYNLIRFRDWFVMFPGFRTPGKMEILYSTCNIRFVFDKDVFRVLLWRRPRASPIPYHRVSQITRSANGHHLKVYHDVASSRTSIITGSDR